MRHNYLTLFPFTIIDAATPCIDRGFPSRNTVRSQALMISKIVKRDSTQRIFPSMNFSCTGLVTKWIIGGEPRMTKDPLPELQLWRKTDGVNYIKTDVSSISKIPNSTPHKDVFEYILNPPLEVHKGDVFGIYKPKENESLLNIYFQENSGPFAYGVESGANSPLSRMVADSAMLLDENDYPMVSAEVLISGE